MRIGHDLSFVPFSVAQIQKLLLGVAATMLSGTLYVQDASGDSAALEEIEEIVVTECRATIQSTIDIKRISATIVDGFNATEISIRGFGPFLGATTLNGR